MNTNIICSSPTKEGLVALLKQYWYATHIEINDEGQIINSKGVIANVSAIQKKNRWQAVRK